MNTKLVEKNLIKKTSKDFSAVSVKDEDWKYIGKNIYTVNEFEVGKPGKLEKNKNFNLDSNCYEFATNTNEKNIEIIDLEEIKKSTIDESIKRPFDKFSVEQFEKLTGGFQLNVKDDFSDYFSINFQSEETSVPYLGVNMTKNKSGKLLLNFGELIRGDIFPTIEIFLEQNASLELIINVTSKNDVSIINFDTLGFTYPPSDSWYTLQNNGGSPHYDIYIFNLEPGYYGYVQGESYSQNNSMINRGDNENSIDIKEKSSMVSFMAIRNDYSSFTGNINEILQATISHEFFHAIQYGYDGWEAGWLLESTAVWMEELHYDHINDCYQFLEDNFDIIMQASDFSI